MGVIVGYSGDGIDGKETEQGMILLAAIGLGHAAYVLWFRIQSEEFSAQVWAGIAERRVVYEA